MDTGLRTPWRGGWLARGDNPTPCGACPKCPKGELACPETGEQSELSEKNQRAWVHFLESRGALTEEEKTDSICRRNRGIIERVLMRHDHK